MQWWIDGRLYVGCVAMTVPIPRTIPVLAFRHSGALFIYHSTNHCSRSSAHQLSGRHCETFNSNHCRRAVCLVRCDCRPGTVSMRSKNGSLSRESSCDQHRLIISLCDPRRPTVQASLFGTDSFSLPDWWQIRHEAIWFRQKQTVWPCWAFRWPKIGKPFRCASSKRCHSNNRMAFMSSIKWHTK